MLALQEKLFGFCILLTLYLLLLIVNDLYISIIYAYMGFSSDVDLYEVFLSIVVIFIAVITANGKDTLAFYQYMILVLIMVPTAVLYSAGVASGEVLAITLLSTLIVNVLSNIRFSPYFFSGEVAAKPLIRILVVLSFAYIIAAVMLGGMKYFNLSIFDVYEFRELAQANLPWYFGYFYSVVSKVFIPIILAMSWKMRSPVYGLLGVALAVVTFGLTSHKAVLLAPVLIVALNYFSFRGIGLKMAAIFVATVAVSWADFYLDEHVNMETFGDFGSMFARRVLLVPAQLNSFYIEYFSVAESYYWADSRVSFGLINSPYTLSSVNLIGMLYLSNENIAANSGWIGSGYANAGLMGAIIYSVLLAVLLAYLRECSNRLGAKFVTASSATSVMIIINSTDIVTAIFTHGLLFLLLIYSLNIRYENFEKEEQQ